MKGLLEVVIAFLGLRTPAGQCASILWERVAPGGVHRASIPWGTVAPGNRWGTPGLLSLYTSNP